MANFLDENDRKDLYRKMLADNATSESTKKYSFKQFETKILGDDKLLNKLSNLAVKRDWAIDQEDFFYKYAPEKLAKSRPQPKVQAAPAQQFPMGIAAPAPIKEAAPSSQLNAFNQYGQRDLFLKEIQKTPQDQIREAEEKSMALYPYANKPDIDKAIEEYGIEEVLKNIPLKEKDPRIQKTVTQTPSSVVPELLKPLKNEPIGENAPIAEPKKPGVAALPNYKGFFDSPTAKLFSDTVPNSKYRYGAKDINGPDIDCSGAVCHVLKQKGIEYDSATTNAAKLYKNAYKKNIPIEKAADGDIIAINTEGKNIDHIGFVVRDKEGNLGIAESSSSYNGTTITPFKERIENLKQLHPNMKWDIASVDKNRKISGAKVVQPGSVAAPSQTITDIAREMAFKPPVQPKMPKEEEEAYTPPPQPLVGSPEYDAQLQRQYGGMAPTLGATFPVTAVFETPEQKKQEQLSPVFKAQQLAFEDVPIASEQRKAQRQFAKLTKQEKEAALRGGTGFELQQKQANERREATKKLKDFGSSMGVLFDNMISKVKAAEAMFGAKQRSLLTFGEKGKKAEEQEKKIKQQVLGYLDQVDQDFATKQAEYNIEGNIYDVISKGQLDRLPEAFAYNLAQIGINALGAGTTGGYSTFAQVVPDIYKAGVEEIARKTNTTPEEVIASGKDKEIIAYAAGVVSGGIDYYSSGLLGSAMRSKGAYKFLRDLALDKIGKTKWKQAAASAAALGGVANIEAFTEGGQGLIEVAAPQIASAKSFKEARQNIYGELQKPSTQRRLASDIVGGAAGGGGLVAGGRGLERVLQGDFTYGDVRKSPATQRADMDIVQTDNKIQERNKIAQAMESAIQANPEAEGQIREQYQKPINEAAPTDEEVLAAYEGLALLPETEEKNTIRQNLEAYMAEKGIQPEAAGMDAGLGEGLRVSSPEEAPVIRTVNPQFPPPQATPPTEEQIADDIQNKRFATFTYKSEEEVPEQFRDRILSTGEINGERFVRVTLPQSVADYELSRVSPEVTPEVTPEPVAPTEEVTQEDEDLASLGQEISGLEQAPVEEAAPEVVPEVEVPQPKAGDFVIVNGEKGVVVVTPGGQMSVETDTKIYDLDERGIAGIGGRLVAPKEQTQTEYEVEVIDDDNAIVNGEPFKIIRDEKGNTIALQGETRTIRTEPVMVDVDVKRNKAQVKETPQQQAEEVEMLSPDMTLDGQAFVDDIVGQNITEGVDRILTDGVTDKTAEKDLLQFKLFVEATIADLRARQKGNPYAEAMIEQLQEALNTVYYEYYSQGRKAETGTSKTQKKNNRGVKGKERVSPKPAEGKQPTAPVKPTPAAPKKEESPKPEPTSKQIDKKSVQASLDKAKEEYEKAKGAFDKKRSELDKTTREDVKNLFGERKVEMKAKGLFEMPRISPEQRERAIQPFRDRMNKAKEEVNRLTKMLEEGEEAARELTFEKQKEYEQVQGVSKETRKGKSTPKAERAVRPKAKPIRNAGKTPDAITARNIAFYGDPVATTLQYLMDATYHPDLLESIFGGPSKTTKSGRKDISGERRSRIQFLDNNSNVKTADKLAEVLAERYAEENSIDVKDAEQQHDFASIATDIVSSYSSRSQMVRELLRLNDQQSEAFDFMYNPEEIYGEGYNEDIAKDIDGILDELPDSYWEGKEISDEDFGNLFAEEVASPSAEFTSKQESSASTEFDGTKKPSKIKMNSFDGKHGKGAFQRMKNITDNFEDIMDGLSEKIKQDCL